MKAFITRIAWVEFIAIAGLILVGAVLSWTDSQYRYGDNFFTYRVWHLDNTPAWLASILLLIAINGIWLFRLAVLEANFQTPSDTRWGEWRGYIPINPLRLFAVNLICIPGILGLFMLVRANRW